MSSSPTTTSIDESGITIIPDQIMTAEQIQKVKLCQICQLKDWIYTCPRCLCHTCSLPCVKKHKQEASCSGERDKTAYVPLQKYTESHMMSDYTYLEDVSRKSDNLTRSRSDTSHQAKIRGAENKAKMFSKFANQLGIQYSSLPIGMSRNKLNQSNYSKHMKQIFWSIEVNFCKNGKRERYLEHSFPSNKPFYAFFENLLLSENPQGKGEYGIIRHQVKDFITAGIDQFSIALKKEKAPRGHFVNVTNELDALFRDVLRGEVIIEYPIFYIWLKNEEQPSDVLVLEEKKTKPLITAIRTDNSEMNPVDDVKPEEAKQEEVEQKVEQEVEQEEEQKAEQEAEDTPYQQVTQ